MKLYFATGSRQYLWYLFICNVKHILISFAYLEPWKGRKLIKQNKVELICDSGAFTAWNKGASINIDKYIQFIKDYEEIITHVVNLDVIPGTTGSEPTVEDIELAAEQGWKNLEIMKAQKINPIHVFHQGEDFKWLTKMINSGLDYIGISPCNDFADLKKMHWLDHSFRLIANSINPNIKTHGFGVTSNKLLERYPWYSCDSSSYSLSAAFGNILTKHGVIKISRQHKTDRDYILNKPQPFIDALNKEVENLGFNIHSVVEEEKKMELLKTSIDKAYSLRNILNIMTLLDLEEKINENGPTLAYLRQGVLFETELSPKKS